MTPEEMAKLVAECERATEQVKLKMEAVKAGSGSVSITDMLELQMLMNRLSQLSEMSASVISASNSAIQSIARNIKS